MFNHSKIKPGLCAEPVGTAGPADSLMGRGGGGYRGKEDRALGMQEKGLQPGRPYHTGVESSTSWFQSSILPHQALSYSGAFRGFAPFLEGTAPQDLLQKRVLKIFLTTFFNGPPALLSSMIFGGTL